MTDKTDKTDTEPEKKNRRYLSLKQLEKETGLTTRYLMTELKAGRIRGRNFGGQRGWQTTLDEVDRHVFDGNADARKATETAAPTTDET